MLSITTMSSSGSMAGATGKTVFTLLPCPISFSRLLMLFMVVLCGLEVANGLKCYKCGQYNEGVGSITPCLNYSEQYQHLYLKECSKKSDNYCVKYVTELSTVRDCANECQEKEIWETQTYCCNTDGCNIAANLQVFYLAPLITIVAILFCRLMDTASYGQR